MTASGREPLEPGAFIRAVAGRDEVAAPAGWAEQGSHPVLAARLRDAAARS